MRVTLTGTPTPEQAAEVWRELFPGIDLEDALLAKAAGDAKEGTFEEWFIEQLAQVTQSRIVTSQRAIWEVLDRLLQDRGVEAPSELGYWELRRILFDLSTASTARMVGFHLPDDLAHRLSELHFTLTEQLDFPAVAYRMGRIFHRLMQEPPVQWEELRRLASEFPLAAAEEAAVAVVRAHAGVYLQPIYDQTGALWTAEREIEPLRAHLGEALAGRGGVRETGRLLGNSQRARGIQRDAERVARTEIANARSRGAWRADAGRWSNDMHLFRQTSSRACKGCLRLYKNPDGTPRLYRRSEVEAFDALGPNRGGWQDWHPTIGATHPNCACPPWAAYVRELQPLFERDAGQWAATIRRLGVFREAA